MDVEKSQYIRRIKTLVGEIEFELLQGDNCNHRRCEGLSIELQGLVMQYRDMCERNNPDQMALTFPVNSLTRFMERRLAEAG